MKTPKIKIPGTKIKIKSVKIKAPKIRIKKMPSINPLNYLKGASIKFTIPGLPFIFTGDVNCGLSHNKSSMHLDRVGTPQVVQLYGVDHTKPIKVAKNDFEFPKTFLHCVFCMCRNRAMIQYYEDRKWDTNKREFNGHSLWHWYNYDQINVSRQWQDIKDEIMKRVASRYS